MTEDPNVNQGKKFISFVGFLPLSNHSKFKNINKIIYHFKTRKKRLSFALKLDTQELLLEKEFVERLLEWNVNLCRAFSLGLRLDETNKDILRKMRSISHLTDKFSDEK